MVNLCQHVNNYTRERVGQQPSTLDLVFTNEVTMVNDIEIRNPLGKSDHAVLLFDYICYATSSSTKESYLCTKGDYKAMRAEIQSYKWETLQHSRDINKMWDEFESVLIQLTDKYVPKWRPKTARNERSLPWFNSDIRQAIQFKHHEWNRYQKNRTEGNWDSYVRARRRTTRLVRQAKKLHERKIVKSIKKNSKGFWKLVRQKTKVNTGITDLVVDGKAVTSDIEKAEALNNHFSSVFTIENLGNVPQVITRVDTVQEELSITEAKLIEILSRLKVDKSPGPDKIHNRVLYEIRYEIVGVLTYMLDFSLNTGQVPKRWKEAEVIPIFKKGARSDPNNYRPVSLTATCCKIMETVIRDSLLSYLENNNLISDNQHGFRPNRSCVTQLLEVIHDWSQALDKASCVDVIYLDYSKAFDSVPHERLLAKLGSYGIDLKVQRWIRNFLLDRTQRVVVNGIQSQAAQVTSGVPQGSVLGPILFLMFINDISDGVRNTLKLFADDSKIYKTIKSHQDALELENDLDCLMSWSDRWQLSFNVKKCKVLHMGLTNMQHKYTMRYGNDKVALSEVESEKDLGIMFDSEMKFQAHINDVCNRGYQRIAVIRRTFTYMDKDMFLLLYKSLIRPVLEYGNTVWSVYFKKEGEKLEKVQRRATKMVQAIKHFPYPDRLKYLDLPTLVYRRRRADLLQVFRYFSGLDQYKGENIFILDRSKITRGHSLRLMKQRANTTVRQKSLSFRVVNDWNSLPEAVVTAVSVNSFKRQLEILWQDADFKFDPSGYY